VFVCAILVGPSIWRQICLGQVQAIEARIEVFDVHLIAEA
jgi:hypothetical protein